MKKVLLYLAAMAIPAIICLSYILNYGVSVPFMDEWEMVAFSQKTEAEGLHFSDLFAQHNEHRIFFARLVYLGIVALTDYNTVALMCFSFLMLSIAAFLVVNYIGRRQQVSRQKRYLFAILTSFLIYSLVQSENLLWGFQIGFVMVLVLSVVSFYCLYRALEAEHKQQKYIYFALAVLFAFIDSFSHSQGLITWVTAAVLMLLVFGKRVFKSPYFILWMACAALSWGIYFNGYVKPEHHPSLTFLFEQPGIFIQYFLSILGNALAGGLSAPLAVLAGLVIVFFLLIAVVLIWKRKQVQFFFFPLALVLNSLFILGSIALGRAGFGVEQSLAGRYTSFALCAVVGLLLLWMELKDKQEKKSLVKNMAKVAGVLVALSIPVALLSGFRSGAKVKAERLYAAYVLELVDSQPDPFLQQLYPWPDLLRSRATYLQAHHLNVFHAPKYGVPAVLNDASAAQYAQPVLQYPQQALQLGSGFIVMLRPMISPAYNTKVQALYLDIDGQVFPLYTPVERAALPPDPQRIVDLSAIRFDVLPKGLHTAKLKALALDGASYFVMEPGWQFEVR